MLKRVFAHRGSWETHRLNLASVRVISFFVFFVWLIFVPKRHIYCPFPHMTCSPFSAVFVRNSVCACVSESDMCVGVHSGSGFSSCFSIKKCHTNKRHNKKHVCIYIIYLTLTWCSHDGPCLSMVSGWMPLLSVCSQLEAIAELRALTMSKGIFLYIYVDFPRQS